MKNLFYLFLIYVISSLLINYTESYKLQIFSTRIKHIKAYSSILLYAKKRTITKRIKNNYDNNNNNNSNTEQSEGSKGYNEADVRVTFTKSSMNNNKSEIDKVINDDYSNKLINNLQKSDDLKIPTLASQLEDDINSWKLQNSYKSNNSNSNDSDISLKAKDFISTVLIADFFVVMFFLVWFIFGAALKNVNPYFLEKFQDIFQ